MLDPSDPMRPPDPNRPEAMSRFQWYLSQSAPTIVVSKADPSNLEDILRMIEKAEGSLEEYRSNGDLMLALLYEELLATLREHKERLERGRGA
jgi:hypothetical protein